MIYTVFPNERLIITLHTNIMRAIFKDPIFTILIRVTKMQVKMILEIIQLLSSSHQPKKRPIPIQTPIESMTLNLIFPL